MGLVFYLVLLLIIMVVIAHVWTTSREMDSMGWLGGKEYQKFLSRRSQSPTKTITEIPPPPGGKRDLEVEALILSGKLRKAKELLMQKMEDARLAPVGSAQKIATMSHYIDFLNDPAYYSDL